MKEEEKLLVLCDEEEEYARLLTDFLQKQRDLPWRIHTYTGIDELMRSEKEPVMLLAVSAEIHFVPHCGRDV